MRAKPTGSFLSRADGIDWVALCEPGASYGLKQQPMLCHSFLREFFFLLPE
jgi:hypothetical protein